MFLVSSQTDTGPDGELIVGKVTQFIFPSIKHSVLSDVEGKKLKISPYERIKSRLSRLISSIIEIKDQGIPVNTRTTQFPSCGKICEDITRDKRSDTSRFETPWLKKVGNFMEHVNKGNKVDDPSSCTCCKLYKESLNINAGDN
ncbi:unnamed protein product [Euphydryas editha]|uniref:Uncharacterized protein n=1 Tax=Euphydryas editha TaxID=104508 RepID=A0AAU9UY48_EUPED|nr:unnamed protein product [Euphydryas editha]